MVVATDLVRAQHPPSIPADGRRARGERTRIRVLEALLELVEQGSMRPTAQEVAERANVALRTVYHHFEDVEALRTMALDHQVSRHHEILQPIDPAQPLDERIGSVARQHRRLFELITPIRRATLFDEHGSSAISEGLRRNRAERRNHLAAAFAPELSKFDAHQQGILDAIDVVTSWHAWNELRSGIGRSAHAAERTVILSLEQLLTPTQRN